MLSTAQGQDLTGLAGWVADVVSALGWPGVTFLVAVENVFPPMPSEVILPFAGFVAAREHGTAWAMIAAATAGSVIGAVFLYGLGRRIGQDRTRRWLCRLPLVETEEVDGAIEWFHRHGSGSVFFGRFTPFVRSVVSLPAGAAGMGVIHFLLLTTLGSLIWNTIWVGAGYLLGREWQRVAAYSDWINYGLIAAVVVLVARFVWRRAGRIGAGG